jgi:serine protease Do
MKRLRWMFWGLLAVALTAPAQQRAPAGGPGDPEETLAAIVRVKSRIVPGARSAATLGMQREGSGVLVREGYVATIGYLVIEADAVEVTALDGKTVPATVAGYDHASGFGLLKLLAPLPGKPLALGDAEALAEREPAMIARFGGRDGVSVAFVVSRRPFSGSWEYQLDSAIFTYPAVPDWSGAALINVRGELVGIGSLVVNDAVGQGTASPGNMFVPVNLLRPILDDLIASGRRPGPVRPWLGMNVEELRGRLFVMRVSPEGPAERAGLRSGDIVVGVGGEDVSSLAELYARIWNRGAAGVEVPLRVLQGTQVQEITVRSIDRLEYFKQKAAY